MKTMSDILNAFTVSKFKEKISLCTDHCLNYVKYECVAVDSICFTVNIPNEYLRSRCHSVLCSPVLSVPPNTGH